jgi:hypothetical protein
MALKGNLRDFSVTQLLNLIHVAQKTGTLVVERPGANVLVCFREGKLAYVQDGQEDNSLASILYQARKLTTGQYRTLKEKAASMNDKELGLLLINANYVSQQDILTSLQTHFLNTVNMLFSWVDGLFRFDNDLLAPDNKITVRISLENLIIDGSRRLREQEQLQDEIPSLDMALKFVDRPGSNIRDLNLSIEEWRVVRYVNPKNSIRQIATATKLNDLQIRRIVYSLLQAGVVEIIRPSTPAAPQPPSRLPLLQKSKPEQKSLLNRLISRIRAI